MNAKKIVKIAVCALAFGGVVATTTGCSASQDQLNAVVNDYKAADAQLLELIQSTKKDLEESLANQVKDLKAEIAAAKSELQASISELEDETAANFATTIETLEGEVDALETEITEKLKDNYYTYTEVETLVKYYSNVLQNEINELVTAINKVIDDFRGEAAQKAKADGVVTLEKAYDALPDDLVATYDAAIKAGVDADAAEKEYKRVLAALQDTLYYTKEEGKVYIILANDAAAAKAVAADYAGRINSELYELKLMVVRKQATNAIDALTNIDDTTKAYFNGLINTCVYDSTAVADKTSAEKTAYYEDLVARVTLAKYAGEQYDVVVAYAATKKAAVDALTNLTADQKKDYDDKIDSIAALAKYKEDTDIEPILTTETETDDVDDVVTADKNAMDLATYKATKYDSIVDDANKKKDDIDNNPNLTDDEKKDLKDQIDDATSYEDYKKATDDLDNTDDVDQVAEDTKKASESLGYDAEYWSQIVASQNAKESAINALTNLTDAEKAVYINAVKKLTYATYLDDVSEFGTDETKYKEYVASEVSVEADVVKLAVDEDSMVAKYNEAVTYINANEHLTDDEKAYFVAVATAGKVNYSTLSADRSAIKEGMDVTTADANVTAFVADLNEIVAGAEKLDGIVVKMGEVNDKIAKDVEDFENNFLVGHNNFAGDGNTTVEEYQDFINTVVANDAYSYTVPTIAATDAYDVTKKAMDDFVAGLSTSDVEATETTTVNDLNNDVLPNMIATYDEKEAARLQAEKEKYLKLLLEQYNTYKEDSRIKGNAAKENELNTAYARWVVYINDCTKSDDVIKIYNSALEAFEKIALAA